jgi:two-component system, cell cycle response regulator
MPTAFDAPTDFADTERLYFDTVPQPVAARAIAPSSLAALPAALPVALPAASPTALPAAPPAAVPQRRASDGSPVIVARIPPRLGERRGAARNASPMPIAAVPIASAEPFVAPPTSAAPRALQLFVRGFNEMEKKLLEGMVRLSQRRLPRLALVTENEALAADLVMVDGSDAAAVAWAESQHWLNDKTTIWIDSSVPRPGHTLSQRPVQWPLLPMMLARAMERLPMAKAPAAAPPQAASPEPAPARKQVLVVDDSLAVRNHLRSLLEARGVQVSEASCVREAMARLGGERFSCVLMDVLMPDMDGYEGCKRIKASKASLGVLPVVMLTSKASPFDRIRGKMAGCDAYLTKPVAPAQLHATLDTYLGAEAVAKSLSAPAAPRIAPDRLQAFSRG